MRYTSQVITSRSGGLEARFVRFRVVLVRFPAVGALEVHPAGRFAPGPDHGFSFFLVSLLKGRAGRTLGDAKDPWVDCADLPTMRTRNFYGLLRHSDLHRRLYW